MIEIAGEKYPIGFGPLAVDQLERLTDVSVADWDPEKLSHQYSLIYACVKQGCRRENRSFLIQYESFIDMIPMDKTYIKILEPCVLLMYEQFKQNQVDEKKG